MTPTTLTRPFHDWTTLRTKMEFVFDVSLPKSAVTGSYERQGEYSAWLIKKGWAKITAEGKEVTATPGQWLFCFSQKIHQEFSTSVRLLSVRLKTCWPQDELLYEGPPFLVVEASDHPRLEELAQRMIEIVHMPSWRGLTPQFTFSWKTHIDFHGYLKHQSALLEWMEQVSNLLLDRGWTLHVPRGVDSRLARILNHLESLEYKMQISPTQLARNSGLTLQQANRMCQRAYGCTVLDYWNVRRLERAKIMLDRPGQSIKETASFLGFSQLSHFSAWFKRLTGSSPRKFVHR